MNAKEKLIIKIIESGLKPIIKIGKDQEKMIKDLRKNGYGDVHPFHMDEMKSGISYTHGYAIGHKCLAETVLELLKMTESEVQEYIDENLKIEKENRKYMKTIRDEMKRRINQRERD